MEVKNFAETFPLFNSADTQTLESLLSVATEHEYPAERAVLMEDAWGNAVYFIESGWVKVRRLTANETVTLAILGKGDFFGEMAILDESPRSTDVVALSQVKLVSISAQRFIQTLFKDPQLHHRMLQLMVKRLRLTNVRLQLLHHPPAIKLANKLVNLIETYGQKTPHGIVIYNIPIPDLANLADITPQEAAQILQKLQEKNWIKIVPERNIFLVINVQQLATLAQK
jgi:CRP/FNR family transcriptional regulator, cyclic AMP receptor protein